MKSRHNKLISIIISLLIISVGLSIPVYGEEESSSDLENAIKEENNSATLQISPVSARLSLEPGKTVEKEFTVTNSGSVPFEFRVYASPYSAEGENYSNDFISQTQYTKISEWIDFIGPDDSLAKELTLTLNSGQSIDIKYQINVPENVSGGGQYACIFAETVDDGKIAEGIKAISRAGLIVIGSVEGEVRRLVKIGDIDINPVLYNGKVNVTANVENTGNMDFQASLSVSIKSFFGKELYNRQVVNTVFPETTRKVYTEWDDTPYYGLFRLSSTVSALGTEVKSERDILVMPPLMIAFSIVLLAP